MYKVTETSADTSLSTIESATSLSEICNRAEFAVDGSCSIPAAVQVIAGLLRRVLVLEARIDVADKMVVVVVAHDELLYLAILAHLAPDVLVEGVKVVL